MGRISTYMQVSLDGYFAGPDGEIDWFKDTEPDPGFDAYSLERAQGGSVLLFGRTTYDMMAAWWPTLAAAKAMPEVAAQMNAVSKIVFSQTLTSAHWNNTTLIKTDLVGTIRRMKAEPGPDMAILSFLAGLRQPLNLTFTHARTFGNGSVVLSYAPVR